MTCPFCNSQITPRSIIKIFHDWGEENNQPISDQPTKAAFDVLKKKFAATNTAFENANKHMQTIADKLEAANKNCAELQQSLSREEKNAQEYEKLFRTKDAGFKEKHTQLMQALNCLNQVSIISSLKKDSPLSHLFPLSQEYHHNHLSIVRSIKKLRDNYVSEARYPSSKTDLTHPSACEEFRKKYLAEVEAHRKTRERADIFQQLVSRTPKTPVFDSQVKPGSIAQVCLSIQELIDKSGLLPPSS